MLSELPKDVAAESCSGREVGERGRVAFGER